MPRIGFMQSSASMTLEVVIILMSCCVCGGLIAHRDGLSSEWRSSRTQGCDGVRVASPRAGLEFGIMRSRDFPDTAQLP